MVGEEFRSRAEKMFWETGIKVVFSQRLLGGVIGDEKGKKDYINNQVKKWKEELMCLHQLNLKQLSQLLQNLFKPSGLMFKG